VTGRLVELDRLGRGSDLDGVLLNRPLGAATEGAERGAASQLRRASDPPWPSEHDRPVASLDDAA
jgi:hypothetical protein